MTEQNKSNVLLLVRHIEDITSPGGKADLLKAIDSIREMIEADLVRFIHVSLLQSDNTLYVRTAGRASHVEVQGMLFEMLIDASYEWRGR